MADDQLEYTAKEGKKCPMCRKQVRSIDRLGLRPASLEACLEGLFFIPDLGALNKSTHTIISPTGVVLPLRRLSTGANIQKCAMVSAAACEELRSRQPAPFSTRVEEGMCARFAARP